MSVSFLDDQYAHVYTVPVGRVRVGMHGEERHILVIIGKFPQSEKCASSKSHDHSVAKVSELESYTVRYRIHMSHDSKRRSRSVALYRRLTAFHRNAFTKQAILSSIVVYTYLLEGKVDRIRLVVF